MGRIARVVIPGMPHHVTSCGNGCLDIFRGPSDYRAYLDLLAVQGKHHGLDIWSYCLMPDHVHLVVVPQRMDSLARALRDANATYAHRVSHQYHHCGKLWHDRFSSCVLDHQSLWTAIKFVEQNPVRAGLAARAEEYRWSSAPAQCGGQQISPAPPPSLPESLKAAIPCWSEWLAEKLPDAEAETLRSRTRTGRPYGSDWFVRRLEESLGRRLAPRVGGWEKGRPRRRKESSAVRPKGAGEKE